MEGEGTFTDAAFKSLSSRLLAAEAGGVDFDFGPGQRLVELLLDQARFHGLAPACQAFMQAVQAP